MAVISLSGEGMLSALHRDVSRISVHGCWNAIGMFCGADQRQTSARPAISHGYWPLAPVLVHRSTRPPEGTIPHLPME